MKTKLTREDVLNWWLQKYHNTTVEELVKTLSDDVKNSADWFKLYPVTQEQHDEWYTWVVDALTKERRMSKTYIIKHFALDYLNCAPYIEQNK
jgi:hypothetical protein